MEKGQEKYPPAKNIPDMAMQLGRTRPTPSTLARDMGNAPTTSADVAPLAVVLAEGRLRWLVILIWGLPLVALNIWWVVRAEKVGHGPYFTTISLFANVLFTLTVLLILNAGLRRLLPRVALSRAELMLLYSMTALGAALAGHDCVPSLIMMLGYPYRYANASNAWTERFGQYLPTPLMVPDKAVLKGYFEGNSSLYLPDVLRAWAGPTFWWTVFVVLLLWTMACLNTLVYKGWRDRERLPFPIVEIPLQMTDPSGALWRNRLFWVGFGLCAAVEILNGLAWLYPQLPKINVQHVDLEGQGIFASRPFNAAGFTCYSFYPFAIGLGYLLPLDLLFSCWFFYLFWKAQMILSAQFALDVVPEFPFVREQGFGGFIAILIFLLWNGRNYFREVWKRIGGEPSDVSDDDQPLRYRTAALGAVGGFAALVGFMAWAGMSPLWAVAAFAIYFSLSLAVSRIRAELGPPVHDLHFTGPDHILTRTLGVTAFGGRDLTLLTYFYWFNRAYRSHPQPFLIEAQKAGQDTRSSARRVFWAMQLTGLIGTVCVFWAYLHFAYDLGTQAKFGQGGGFANEAFNRLGGWIQSPTPPNGYANGAIGVGFVFCSLLMLARTRYPWWPFHPIGYAISGSWSMNLVWMPLLIAWIVKFIALRYGGVRLYRQWMPFFLGLILGQMLVGSLWHLIGLALGIEPYSFWGG